MGFFNILGRISLNTKPFEQSLDHAERKARNFAERVEHKVGHHFDKAFGAGLVAGALFRPVEQLLFGGADRIKELDEGSRRLNTTVEKFQMIEAAARDAGVPVDQFAEYIIKQNGSLDAAVQKLSEYREAVKLTGKDVDTALEQQRQMDEAKRDWEGRSIKAKSALYDAGTIGLGLPAMGLRQILRLFGKKNSPEQDAAEQEVVQAWDRLLDGGRLMATSLKKRLTKQELDAVLKGAGPKPRYESYDWKQQSLTARQDIGAYIGVPGDVMVREQQKTNEILERIETLNRDQMSALKDANILV